MSKLILALALFAGLLLTGCRPAEEPAADTGSYRIVTTIAMVADVARNIAGDRATVTNIIGEGVDPHLYKPTRADVARFQEADVILYNGLMLEGKMGDVLVRLARSGKTVYPVTETLFEQSDYLIIDAEQHHDPHVWMDVAGWMRAAEVIATALTEHDPQGAETYQANLETYLEQLRALDTYARDTMATIPENQRVLVTAHDAFGYLGRAYNLEVLGIQGISTESEAGLLDLERLIQRIVNDNIPAVFVETSVADKNVRALVEGAHAAGHQLVIGGSLFSDAMGQPGTYEGTYIGMIDHNVTTITRALGGSAPETGFQGKLNQTITATP
ncbi:metal ABC transporter solute-binding protein, Zn/Mn family [Mucisphaera sp.]|uniref:metal ABC transporter solute-binding protein, Zn/Mn family n=1 Tax=Mucisphaera sp. TaxID=2913024 RepID=UPI003D0E3C25